MKDKAEGPGDPAPQNVAAAVNHLCSLYPQALTRVAAYSGDRPEQLEDAQVRQLEAYLATLLTWRKRMSLVATAEPMRIADGHLLDSLFVAPLIRAGQLVADVGSGAGFPGVPLAIARPQASFVLVESRRKRANFLREVVRSVSLENVEISECRVEELVKSRPREFDAAVARAVWPTADFLRLVQPLLKTRASAIAMKGPQTATDGGETGTMRLQRRIEYRLPGGASRTLLVYENLAH